MQKAECNKHEFSKSVYDMELHEELLAEPLKDITVGGSEFECLPLRVLRVPGGWLYYNMYASNVGVFVPFDNEFEGETNGRND
jgi:hypothetical protein